MTADHSVQANAFSVNDRSMQTDLRNCHLEEMISRANDEATSTPFLRYFYKEKYVLGSGQKAGNIGRIYGPGAESNLF